MRQLTKSRKEIGKEAPTLISGTRKKVYKTSRDFSIDLTRKILADVEQDKK